MTWIAYLRLKLIFQHRLRTMWQQTVNFQHTRKFNAKNIYSEKIRLEWASFSLWSMFVVFTDTIVCFRQHRSLRRL